MRRIRGFIKMERDYCMEITLVGLIINSNFLQQITYLHIFIVEGGGMKIYKLLILTCCLSSILVLGGCEEVETDNTPPTITITHPSPNSVASEIFTITCMAYDNIGLEKVELWIDGLSTGLEDYTEPYSFDWNTTQLDDKIYTVVARAVDESGNITDSSPLSLEVNNRDSYPTSVEIYAIEYTDNSLMVRWSMNKDGDFGSYTLLESFTGEQGSMNQIYTTSNPTDTVFVVHGVPRREIRYYQVSVVDTLELLTNSHIVDRVLIEEIAFSLGESDGLQIYMMDETGENITNLSNNDYRDYYPQWFPDGDQLLFLRFNPSPSQWSSFITMDSDGYNQQTVSPITAPYTEVNFSTDGTMVLYTTMLSRQIYLMEVATGERICLSDPNSRDSSPQFSHDNTVIVYTSLPPESSYDDIFIMNIDGTGKTNISNTETTPEYSPMFFPDGNKIIYSSALDLYSMNLDGSNNTNLSNDESSPYLYKVAPNGSQIVYVASSGGIILVDIDGSNRLNLTNGSGYSGNPIFFPNSESILYTSHRDGVAYIYKIDIDGTNEIQLTNLEGSIGHFNFRP
jgi:Tol biopolymer transport system component